jgi:hypothetical protein
VNKKISYNITTPLVLIISLIILFPACKKKNASPPTRTYYMGFQNSAPRNDFELVLQSLNMWAERADAAIISVELPWDSLYEGVTPEKYVLNNYKGLADFYRDKGFKLWVYIDPANGLDRSADSRKLSALGKSIAQYDAQQHYRRFAFVMDSILQPEHLGLALETNLIRGLAPDSIYQAVKKAANDAAGDIRQYDKDVKLSVSVQVDRAWGYLGNDAYEGVEQDFIDFPFIDELGLSSYPYFDFDTPEEIPADYYSRLVEGKNIPVFVSECGWSSETVATFAGTPEKQKNYILRQSELLDKAKAIALFQLTFTDVDVSALPPDIESTIHYFTHIGLVDTVLNPKPALEIWDNIFERELKDE